MPEPYMYYVEDICCPHRYRLHLSTSEREIHAWVIFTIWGLHRKIRELIKNYGAIPRDS